MSGGADIQTDFITLVLFWLAAYVSDLLARVTSLSPLLFYLVIGCIYGNTKIVEKTVTITFIAELAITFVFFALGFEENVPHFLHGIKKAWGIASIGAIVPFGCGYFVAYIFFPDEGTNAHMMCGLAVTATAVSLTMITLKSKGLAISRAAIGIMTSAVLDDVACLALVAIMVPIATGESDGGILGIIWIVCKSIIFFAIICFLNVVVFPHNSWNHPIMKYVPFVRSHGIRPFLTANEGTQGVCFTILLAFCVGLIALAFGFHPAIGAYMCGLILAEDYYSLPDKQMSSPVKAYAMEGQGPPEAGEGAAEANKNEMEVVTIPAGNIYESVKDSIDSVAFVWLGPIFFLNLGSQILIKVDVFTRVIGQAVCIYVILFVGQLLSATLAARYVPGGFTWQESWMIGFGMLGRAELFFVVLNICYLDNQIISEDMFFALTIAAMMLNVTVPIAISAYRPFYIGEKHCGCCKHDGVEDFLHHPHLPHVPHPHMPHLPHIHHPHAEHHMSDHKHAPALPHPHMPHNLPHPHMPNMPDMHVPHPHMPHMPHMPHSRPHLPHPHMPNYALRPSGSKGHIERGTTREMFNFIQKKAMREERARARRVVQFSNVYDLTHAVDHVPEQPAPPVPSTAEPTSAENPEPVTVI